MATGGKAAAASGRREVLVHVEEDRARDVPGPPGGASPAGRIEVEARVDDAQPRERRAAGRGDLASEPGGVDERVHRPESYFICVIGCGTFL
jgi:hypothetical protein